jgi:hypothetical protein
MPSTGTDTVLTREAAWLCISTDSLPALLTVNGGPWDIIQAYWRRTPPKEKTEIYVTRTAFDDNHPMSQRYRPQHEIVLRLYWPVRQATSPLAEQEQQALDSAIELLIQRIRDVLGDKTHGGAFLSAAEAPRGTSASVRFEDAEMTIAASQELRATVTYRIDDLEFNG